MSTAREILAKADGLLQKKRQVDETRTAIDKAIATGSKRFQVTMGSGWLTVSAEALRAMENALEQESLCLADQIAVLEARVQVVES